MPASRAVLAQLSGLNFVGFSSFCNPQYHFLNPSYVVALSRSIQSSEHKAQDSIIPGTAYNPQCKINPNFWSCHLSSFSFTCGSVGHSYLPDCGCTFCCAALKAAKNNKKKRNMACCKLFKKLMLFHCFW